MNAQAIATASGVDIDIINEERKDKYIVETPNVQEEEKAKKKLVKKVSKERRIKRPAEEIEKDSGVVQSVEVSERLLQERDDSKQIKEKGSEIVHDDAPRVEKKLTRVRSADSKDVKPVKRSSGKSRKQPASHSNSPFDRVTVSLL